METKQHKYELQSQTFPSKTVYITYIASTPEKIWQALTSPEFTKQYFFGRRIESDWKVGSLVTYWMDDNIVDVRGVIKESDRPRLLSFTWVVERMEQTRDLPPCLVTFEIEQMGDVVKLTMTESHTWNVPEEMLEGGRQGWPLILSGLKTLLETGKAMPFPQK
jgi:uncharacterized protein YndB with AHSA1/START domain